MSAIVPQQDENLALLPLLQRKLPLIFSCECTEAEAETAGAFKYAVELARHHLGCKFIPDDGISQDVEESLNRFLLNTSRAYFRCKVVYPQDKDEQQKYVWHRLLSRLAVLTTPVEPAFCTMSREEAMPHKKDG